MTTVVVRATVNIQILIRITSVTTVVQKESESVQIQQKTIIMYVTTVVEQYLKTV